MIRRKLAALLAGAMILTSLPMVSFAASDNRVDRIPTIKKDTDLTPIPNLVIDLKDGDDLAANDKFTLSFDNAEWRIDDDDLDPTKEYVVGDYAYKIITKKLLEFRIVSVKDKYSIPMFVKVKDAGEAKVTIDSMGSNISAGTYVIANVGDGATKTTITDTKNFSNTLELETIVIEELKPGTIEDVDTKVKEIKLTAPAGFEWVKGAKLTAAGGFNSITFDEEKDVSYGTYGKDKIDEEVLVIKYSAERGTGNGKILITGLKLKSTKDADYGDVKVTVSGDDITEETIKVGKYTEYGITVKADGDPRELFSGVWELDASGSTVKEDDAHKLTKLVIEEEVVDSWASERKTNIEFPEWFKVAKVKVDDASNIKNNFKGKTNEDDTERITISKDKNVITLSDIEVDRGTKKDKKGKVVLLIWGSIEAGAEGDLVAKVSGQALPESYEVTLAKVLPTVKGEVKPVEVQLGYREVKVNDITITETKAGALKKSKELVIGVEKMGFNKNFKPDVEVTSGDLVLGEAKVKNGEITIEVKRESKTASTIVIKGLSVDIDRTLPEGSYALQISGSAAIENDKKDEKDPGNDYKFDVDVYEVDDFVKIVTPAPHKGEASGKSVKVAFTVGSADYTVEGETVTADVAPYIKDGRTMLPVKYVAYALGIDPSNIKWDQATKTVTILGDRVVQVKIGSKDLVVNGAVLTMDTAAEVKDGRTFLPISWVASALNVPYSWDDATKTVTFN
ncbi:copper amine oxidase N-terminal domain-containing protein [Defluviitalea raffinosedens]|uniref:copper amine oxidase N-terminal domain-containing protein n=1 Tax=Defluviitalea raffinosedens TaxID=1450156 RepID=UPI00195EB0A1|nr:copper amine oxidase N-terminal domain-containing protein [Defluviitalea raffinosedens]MBM7685007.1 hypothetical protein [Defluviitalea raffinosedens]